MTPYDKLDPPIVPLVRALNRLPGLRTIESCGGHEHPHTPVSARADEWWVVIACELVDDAPTAEAWASLAGLARLVTREAVSGNHVNLNVTATRTTVFVLEGRRPYEPDALAVLLPPDEPGERDETLVEAAARESLDRAQWRQRRTRRPYLVTSWPRGVPARVMTLARWPFGASR